MWNAIKQIIPRFNKTVENGFSRNISRAESFSSNLLYFVNIIYNPTIHEINNIIAYTAIIVISPILAIVIPFVRLCTDEVTNTLATDP